MTFLPLCLLGALLLVDSAIAQAPSAPTTMPQNFNFTVRSPSDCAQSSCIFAGVNLNQENSSYVDIYLEGQAQGYVAVGFTTTPNMFSADVVACTRDANNMVRALDSWNAASPGRANQRDPTMEDDIVFHGGEFSNGRIRCTVSKRINGSDENHDINLDTDLYIIYASGNTIASPTDLIQHNIVAGASDDTFSFPPIAATDPLPTMMGPTTSVNPTTPTTPPGPSPPSPPTTDPQNYNFPVRSPSGCVPSNCTIFAGVNLNQGDSNYVDIYLEGAAEGYVAVGFTATPSMFSADVVACTRDASNNDMVRALDSWNTASPDRVNQRDPTMEEDLVFFSGEFVDGRISCSVAKRIIGSDVTHDIDLDSDLYIIYASGNTIASPNDLIQHNILTGVSPNTFSFPPITATDPPPDDAQSTTPLGLLPMFVAVATAVVMALGHL